MKAKTAASALLLVGALLAGGAGPPSAPVPSAGVQEPNPEGVSLTETIWKLVELHGQPVKAAEPGKEPFLQLSGKESRIQGFGGCNRFAGSYELKDGFCIRFSAIAATMMACPEMAAESEFLKVLEETDSCALAGQNLSLNRARMAPLARFEAAARP